MLSFWDSLEILNSIQNLLIFFGIVVGLIWGLKMIRWESKQKPLKTRLIVATIITACYGLLLFIIGIRITELDEIKSSMFEEELKKAKSESGLSQLRADSLEIKLDSVKKNLDLTDQELQKEKEKYIPRKLTEEQKISLYLYLKKQPKGEIEFEAVLLDDESYNFCFEVANLFAHAGYQIKNNKVSQRRSITNIPVGINLVVHSKSKAPKFTFPVQKAFKLIDFEALIVEDAKQPENTLTIKIGTKY